MPAVPLKFTLMLQTRDGTSTTKDARITNLLVEPHGEDEVHFLKRPGFSIYDGTGWSSLLALGATVLPNNEILSLQGTPNGGTNNATVNVSIGSSSYTSFSTTQKSTHISLTNNNLTATSDGTNSVCLAIGNVLKSTGKWYCEITITTAGASPSVGLLNASASMDPVGSMGATANGYEYLSTGQKAHNSSATGYAASWTTGDVISILLDLTAGTLTFWKNGTSQGQAYSGVSGSWGVGIQLYGTAVMTANFGPTFTYAMPAGYAGWPVS